MAVAVAVAVAVGEAVAVAVAVAVTVGEAVAVAVAVTVAVGEAVAVAVAVAVGVVLSAHTGGAAQAMMTSTATSVPRRPDIVPSGRFFIHGGRESIGFFITVNLLLRIRDRISRKRG